MYAAGAVPGASAESHEYATVGTRSTIMRYRFSASCVRSSASFCCVMSNITPCINSGRPFASTDTAQASSRTHTIRPSFAMIRYSSLNDVPSRSARADASMSC